MSRVPPTLRRYIVPQRVLDDSREMLREGGLQGAEAVVLWIGRALDDTTAEILAAIRPGQIAYVSDQGCSVEVPPDALSELITSLPTGTFVLARLHTHPTGAYHSLQDDTNMLISHSGAISIVVPFFARDWIDLARCSVNELRHGTGWIELTAAETAARFEVR